MPKNEGGGFFAGLSKTAGNAPGPGHYHKEDARKCAGGNFSRLARDYGKNFEKSPAVGQYEVSSIQTTPRTRGGLMSRTDRRCIFSLMADKQAAWQPNGPGTYDRKDVGENLKKAGPSFTAAKTESRIPKKQSQVGPGYYNPNHMWTEKKTPCYSGSKEAGGNYLSGIYSNSATFPAYKDISMANVKVEDRIGTRNHVHKLLMDRDLPPRHKPESAVSTAELAYSMEDVARATV